MGIRDRSQRRQVTTKLPLSLTFIEMFQVFWETFVINASFFCPCFFSFNESFFRNAVVERVTKQRKSCEKPRQCGECRKPSSGQSFSKTDSSSDKVFSQLVGKSIFLFQEQKQFLVSFWNLTFMFCLRGETWVLNRKRVRLSRKGSIVMLRASFPKRDLCFYSCSKKSSNKAHFYRQVGTARTIIFVSQLILPFRT